MHYYKVALPIKVNQWFTYKSEETIKRGCRVVVPLHNSILTGIIWEEEKDIDHSIKYKPIHEIVDKKSLLSEQLLTLAQWIARYYFCSVGQALSAMLPSAFNVQIQLQVKRKEVDCLPAEVPVHVREILSQISSVDWDNIKDIKEKVKLTRIYYWLEFLEDLNLVEIKRVFDQKIKKKIKNFVILNKSVESVKLTDKQSQCLQRIREIGKDFPLSDIAADYSYSIVKALRGKKLISVEPREVSSSYIFDKENITRKKVSLTVEQQSVIEKVVQSINKSEFKTFLLHGVTGSGKTEIYINAIQKVLNKGKTALMLVPEISLTPQMVGRLLGVFNDDIAILHSHLNDRERWEEWKKISSGNCSIVVGARSAIFAPLDNIGIIIVDEEHESSYKQDNIPRYNGRDIAVVRARKSNAVCILGSATPSLESWYNVENGKFEKLILANRPTNALLPDVKIIDMKCESDKESFFSSYLIRKIEEKLNNQEQVILLQNRRGYSSFVQCMECGELFTCKNCEISLNYHSYTEELICHYCGNKQVMPRKCPKCGSYHFTFGAPGTQQIEKSLKVLFPETKILRMDSDTAQKKDSYDSMYQRMQNGGIDILLGTQMIAKGLDFHNVTLVGVISADISLNIPDFRAAEKTFQLLTQVAGRSGRGEKKGEVIIQTYNPDHYAINYAIKHDFVNFADMEISFRKNLKYPPYWKIARLVFSHKQEEQIKINIDKNNDLWLNLSNFYKNELVLMGPVPAPLTRIQGQFRYHLILKASSVEVMNSALNYLQDNIKLLSTIKLTIDVDPLSLL